MEKFFSTIITIILVFWLIRWVCVLIGPWLLKTFAKQMMKKAGFDPSAFSGQSQTEAEERSNASDGSRTETVNSGKWWKTDEVILKPTRHDGQRLSDILGGEYVDYEEVQST